MIAGERTELRLEGEPEVEAPRQLGEPAEDLSEPVVAAVGDDPDAHHPATASLSCSLSCSARTRAAIPAASSPVSASCFFRDAA